MKTFLSFLLLSFSLAAVVVTDTVAGVGQCGFDQVTIVFAQDEATQEGSEEEGEEEPDCE